MDFIYKKRGNDNAVILTFKVFQPLRQEYRHAPNRSFLESINKCHHVDIASYIVEHRFELETATAGPV